jgi:CRP-like cAMP-binding protein
MKSKVRPPAKAKLDFDVESYLSAASARTVLSYRRGDLIFSQGDAAGDIRYLQKGAIKLSVLSRIG